MSRGRLTMADLPVKYQNQVAGQLYGKQPDQPIIDDCCEAPSAIAKRAPRNGPLAAPQIKEGNSGKYLVSVISFRSRLLDEDNLCPKYHIDGLRYAGLIPSDAPDRAHIVTTQQKVSTKEEERTEITISQIP